MLTEVRQLVRMLFAPSFCVYCKIFLAQETVLCTACMQLVQPIASLSLPLTPSFSMTVLAGACYQEPLKSVILAKHYGDRLASTYMGKLVWQLSPVRFSAFDYIVPVPLHWTRYASRGFNQAAIMAQVIGQLSNKPVVPFIKRTKATALQASLPAAERKKNVACALQLCVRDDAAEYQQKRFLIVDDLCTTGATLQAAARALLPLKPMSITAVVLCRTV